MLKKLFLLPLAAFMCISSFGQFNYTVKDTVSPYVHLAGATSINGSLIWDEENLTAPMPFTWTMDGSVNTTKFNFALTFSTILADTNAMGNGYGFVFSDADIADRGTLTGAVSLSPIRYITTGTAPNRIFKAEITNGGFYPEYDLYNTMDDSFNVQIWVYETSNIVELRYGPSRVTHPGDYYGFSGTNGPLVGFAKDVDFNTGSTGNVYHLTGTSTGPGIDTFALPPFSQPNGLDAWPPNGTVFRFTPKCVPPTANYTSGTPGGNTVQYTYSGTTIGLDSLKWDFGDGLKQKVTTGFTTPITHTFAANGHYNVCVTAYNSCGSNTYCKQLGLSVGDLAALGNVKVYPNPAGNYITVDGMQSGSTATIVSLIGQQLMRTPIMGIKQQISIAALPAGMYVLKLTNKDGISRAIQITKQ